MSAFSRRNFLSLTGSAAAATVAGRGKGGGQRLARRPQDIVIGEVVRRTEPDMALVPCFAPVDASCVIFSSCALRGVLSEARDVVLLALDGHTLSDLVRPRASLRKLLSFNPNGRTAAA
jgi:Rrf2 family nitric oxide-sensitive transcriptional repressor